jgi:hypothetical protein
MSTNYQKIGKFWSNWLEIMQPYWNKIYILWRKKEKLASMKKAQEPELHAAG